MKKPSMAMVCVLTVFFATQAAAQTTPAADPQHGAEELAKQLANPVASLVSIPFQLNWEEGVGPQDDLRFVLNFQPVVPFTLNERWNLIGRFILPFISQPPLVPGGSTTAGTSDIVLSAFFSPAVRRRAVWGVGPVVTLPTTTDPFLGSGKWSIGPTAVVLNQTGPWTYGALVNHLWSYADTGNANRTDVNQTFLQPFLSYTTKTAVSITLSSEATGNWEATTDENWTVPLLFNVSKVTRLGPFPFSLGAGIGVFVAKPDDGPEWKLRMTGTIILPRAR
jgi:hypothetical protein